ncbi:hypothetical protein PHISCL_01307 [Aspergillus sclerotialis]|uniref:Uncharacterized protein n=1 Tax=Aspergillus sclerotialis TaxID=2070753 RepID=A0A3A3A3Q2_9EURO|nr:hypothetical protein PHISCL_01307 [Aspergillus sclerotialis]
MCGPLYTLHRCGDKTLTFAIYYCKHSTRDSVTGEREICDIQWCETEVCDNNKVCGREDCSLHDKILNGWRCCMYGHVNLSKGSVCEGTVKWIRRVTNGKALTNGEKTIENGEEMKEEMKEGRCWHLICPRCRSVREKGGSICGGDGEPEEREIKDGEIGEGSREEGAIEEEDSMEQDEINKGELEGRELEQTNLEQREPENAESEKREPDEVDLVKKIKEGGEHEKAELGDRDSDKGDTEKGDLAEEIKEAEGNGNA